MPILINSFLYAVFLATPDLAWQSLRAGDWEKAAVAYEAVVAANPYRSVNFLNLGYVQMQMGKCEKAQNAFDRSLYLGGVRHSALYYSARCASLQGDQEVAISWLQQAAHSGFDRFDRMLSDEAFKPIIGDQRVQRLTMTLDLSSAKRVSGWQDDIRYLDQVVRGRHAAPFHTISEAGWARAVKTMIESTDQLADHQIVAGLMRLMASIGDGHSVMYPPFEGRGALSLLPVQPYLFADGVYLRATDSVHEHLLGARLEAIGEVPIDRAMEWLSATLPRDNEMTIRWLMALALRIPELQPATGSASPNSIAWTLRLPDNTLKTIQLLGQAPTGDPLSRSLPGGWKDAAPEKGLPRWLREPEAPYHFEILNEPQAVYFRYNQIRESESEKLPEFLDRLFEQLASRPGQALIIDLRRNNGGNSTLNPHLMHRLVGHQLARQRGKLFVIIGRRTFSAAQNLASDLDRETEAIFVGEPTGSRPNFYGEDHVFRLPYSGLTGSVSTRYWQGAMFSDDDRRWIAPDLVAELTFDDYRSNRDPAMAVILSELERLKD
jgi:tetratricopeptide (TPR) repeat protein